SRIVFNNFVSEPCGVNHGLDQGDLHTGISYLVYNSGLAKIPNVRNNEHGVIFIDNNTLLTCGPDFHETHHKLWDIIQCPRGVDDWAAKHNTKFGSAKYQLLD
ncbi:hypothetical protein B0H17DRAFT_889796, partial [Mycena rosella]